MIHIVDGHLARDTLRWHAVGTRLARDSHRRNSLSENDLRYWHAMARDDSYPSRTRARARAGT
jgi:hypothetical protein